MKRRESKKEAAARKEFDQVFERAIECGHAEARREAEVKRRKWLKQSRRKRKLPKRDLSQINFQAQHWWTEHLKKRDGMTIDEEKAALIYEAMRRRPEVQQAWLEGKFLFGENGWQHFTGWVVWNLPRSWPELDDMAKGGIIKAMHSPWFIPPQGYSTFPENPEHAPEKLKGNERKLWEAKTKEQREAATKRCQQAAMQPLSLPKASENSNAAKAFVEHAQKFVDAGFLIVAVDNKTKQGVRYACEAIEALRRSFRKADLRKERIAYLPPNISDTDKRAVEEKQLQGKFTQHDPDELSRKYTRPASNLYSPWHTVAEVRPIVLHKRKRGGKLVEEKSFNFVNICRELERMDLGRASQGDFVQRLRL